MAFTNPYTIGTTHSGVFTIISIVAGNHSWCNGDCFDTALTPYSAKEAKAYSEDIAAMVFRSYGGQRKIPVSEVLLGLQIHEALDDMFAKKHTVTHRDICEGISMWMEYDFSDDIDDCINAQVYGWSNVQSKPIPISAFVPPPSVTPGMPVLEDVLNVLNQGLDKNPIEFSNTPAVKAIVKAIAIIKGE